MRIYGITGTNGKTTTTWILDEFLGGGGYVTTVEAYTGRRRFSTGYTTPPLPALKEIFAEMEAAGCATCVMEVSSHAIHQRRTGDTVFAGGGFTNLTEDHLDYHKTMEAYFQVKADFFRRLAESTPGAPAAICVDGEYGRRLADICRSLPLRTIECGLSVAGGIKDLKAFKEPQTSIHASVVGSMEFHAVPFQCQCGNLFPLVGLHDDVLSHPGEFDDDYRPYLNPLVELLFRHRNLSFGV